MKRVDKPWGYMIMIKSPHQISDRVKVCLKKLVLLPEEMLSFQDHDYRDETWFVIEGEPTIQLPHQFFVSKPGEIIHIKKGKRHRLINNTEDVVIVLELSIGQKISEDDVHRHVDKYGRK
jgi:mannose-6-phosphate isomerase-like protein (cupin superfamily)